MGKKLKKRCSFIAICFKFRWENILFIIKEKKNQKVEKLVVFILDLFEI